MAGKSKTKRSHSGDKTKSKKVKKGGEEGTTRNATGVGNTPNDGTKEQDTTTTTTVADMPTIFNVKTGMPVSGASSARVSVPAIVNVGETGSAASGLVPGSQQYGTREWYQLLQEKSSLGGVEQITIQLVTYVRNELFPKLKFFMNAKQLSFSAEKDSLCYHICQGMNVNKDYAMDWWDEFKNKILATLNSKRADVTSCIKKAFMSK
jgi:hypothetical protein